MRDYDQLVADATATGTFEAYVGDGASVPWQCALPFSLPLGFTMYAYKAYLDARWPAGFKLHDWCYTPWGALIGVSRLEADEALREYIARTSIVDSLIVYTAVRAGGAPYFGVSQTGYNGPQADGSTLNMLGARAPAERNVGFTMPTKIVLVFQGTTNGAPPIPNINYSGESHTAGFTESMYAGGPWNAQSAADLRGFAIARAALLPTNTRLRAARLYFNGAGTGVVLNLDRQGTAGPTDQMNVALLLQTNNDLALRQRRWWLHNVPDSMVNAGEFKPTFTYAEHLRTYFAALSGYDFYSGTRGFAKSIEEIDNTGLVTLSENQPFAVEQWVTITLTTLDNGRRVGGRYKVKTIGPALAQFSLAGWQWGHSRGGTVFIRGRQLLGISDRGFPTTVRLGTRKVGRPFGGYRGRRSKRQRV